MQLQETPAEVRFPAGLSCVVTIVFTPTVVGTTTGTLTITSGGIPLVVNMTGGAQVNNLVSLVITVPSPTLAAGSTEQLTATGTYGNGTTGDVTAAAVWTSSNTGVLSFGTTPGLGKGVAGGAATVTATVSGTSSGTPVVNTAVVTVSGKTLVSLAVSPASASIPAGLTQTFSAVATYSDNSTATLPTGTATFCL